MSHFESVVNIPASTPNYYDARRRTIVLVWADGTIVTDDPRFRDASNPLMDNLQSAAYGHDHDPIHRIYVGCSFCGDLHSCRIEQVREFTEDDWIYYEKVLVASIQDERHPELPARDEPVCTVNYRIDGRA